MAKVGSFIDGLRGKHISLDEVLSGKVVDKKYRLIDLTRDNVTYDAATNQITIHREDASQSVQIPVRPTFKAYMAKYGDSVHYVTRNGTPSLTPEEKSDPEKFADYYKALADGPKQDLAIVYWRKTDGRKLDTGHSAVSVGQLEMEDAPDAPAAANDDAPRRIKSYRQHVGGSFIASQSLARDHKNHSSTMKEATGRDTGEDPSSHAQGILIRNSIKPAAAALAAGVATYSATKGMKKRKFVKAIRAATAVGAGFGASQVVAAVQNSAGTIKLKDEQYGHGILATLVSPAQHDLMEHAMAGLNKTYYGEYNVLRNNCADFAEDMMSFIGLDLKELIQSAMTTKPGPGHKRRTVAEHIIPRHIRPDRNQWAVERLESGLEGIIPIDGQEIYMRNIEVSGQSALLIETKEGEMFQQPPMEMLSTVLNKAVMLETPENNPEKTQFAYRQPEVTIYPKNPEQEKAVMAR